MSVEKMIGHLMQAYQNALNDETVRKPLSYALYHTWKWVDMQEQERKKEE